MYGLQNSISMLLLSSSSTSGPIKIEHCISSNSSLSSNHFVFPVHDLRHSKCSIISIQSLFRRSVIVILAAEKARSGSADIGRIESISSAIFDRFGNVCCWAGSGHYLIAVVKPYARSALQYCSYSSRVLFGASTSRIRSLQLKKLLEIRYVNCVIQVILLFSYRLHCVSSRLAPGRFPIGVDILPFAWWVKNSRRRIRRGTVALGIVPLHRILT
jgi:hypothetical protein